MASKIIGCGGYLPKQILSNDDLAKIIDTNNDWIMSRTGITQRHIAAEGETTSMMAIEASKRAIKNAGIAQNEINLIIVATTTADYSFPSVSTQVQYGLGLDNIPAFDIQAVCSGFIYGLELIDSLLKSRKYNNILFVCSEKMSSLIDWQDRSTCVLFGDGAGAVIFSYDQSPRGIIDSKIYSSGKYKDILFTDGGISSSQMTGYLRMKGKEVFKLAVENMHNSLADIMLDNNLSNDDITYLIAHQANARILTNIASKLELPEEKLVITIAKHANCSAASIPLALAELCEKNKLQYGDIIAFTAFGAGATWGSALLRW